MLTCVRDAGKGLHGFGAIKARYMYVGGSSHPRAQSAGRHGLNFVFFTRTITVLWAGALGRIQVSAISRHRIRRFSLY
eukprot:scaffold291700_cov13-Prasinocladus_malaysianus.AAC.1